MNNNIQFHISNRVFVNRAYHYVDGSYGWNIKRALDELYSSETYKRLNDPQSGLYYESAVYIFSYLKNEIETGIVK